MSDSASLLKMQNVTSQVKPLVNVGLSAWVVQDGNYGDFEVGQDAKFALEFAALSELEKIEDGEPRAELVTACAYRVRGRVVFVTAGVWVVDMGAFIAFQETKPPEYAQAGTCVEGRIYLGIDPFFYFERLCRVDGMPPLSYRWSVEDIQVESTPWVETKAGLGRAVKSRDPHRQSFKRVPKTDAWNDDDGNAHYVLGCRLSASPERP